MKLIRIASLFEIALLVLKAQDRAGNQIFQVPAGWNRTDVSAATVLSPGDQPKNLVILMLSGYPLNGDFRAIFDQHVKGLNGTLRVIHAGEVLTRHSPKGVEYLATTVELQVPNGARSIRYYIAANPPGRFELMVYMAATAPLFQRYLPAIQQFMTSWNFANVDSPAAPAPGTASSAATDAPPAPTEPAGAAAAAAGPASTKRLDGVYSSYKYVSQYVLGGSHGSAVNEHFSFFPDGTVYWGLPESGLVGFNPARACQGGKQDFCGTYRLNGDELVIVLNRGTYRQVGTLSPGGFRIDGKDFRLQGDISKSAAHALEGDFGRADAQPGEDLARRFIRFTRDGRFADQGVVTTVTGADYSSGKLVFERQAGSGTYALGPYTLILRYSDGYQRQLAIEIEPEDMDKPSFTRLLVNTYTLVRRR